MQQGARLENAQLTELVETGLLLIPRFFSNEEIAGAQREVVRHFAAIVRTAAAKVESGAPQRGATRGFDEPIDVLDFPVAEAAALNHLVCHPRVIAIAQQVLRSDRVLMHMGHVSAKYSGYKNYSQPLHRDSKGISLLPPSLDCAFSTLMCTVYLSDVGPGDGPMSYVPMTGTTHIPNWRGALTMEEQTVLREFEIAATGPVGTLLLFLQHLCHRGTELSNTGAVRYQTHTGYVSSEAVAFVGGIPWPSKGSAPGWKSFLPFANHRQLETIGLPPRDHPFWTPQVLDDLRGRYPHLSIKPLL